MESAPRSTRRANSWSSISLVRASSGFFRLGELGEVPALIWSAQFVGLGDQVVVGDVVAEGSVWTYLRLGARMAAGSWACNR